MKRLISMILICLLLLASFSVIAEESAYTHLEKGSKGDAVKQLQSRLKELGFYSISVDGDYGNGTVTAIKSFEEYNDMEPTGIASIELQEFLFSEDAKGLEIPDIEISKFKLSQRYGSYYSRPVIINNTEHTIDSITYMLKVYNASDERIKYYVLTTSDVCRYENSDDYNIEDSTGEINGLNIKPNSKYSIQKKHEIDFFGFDQDKLDTAYLAVTRYHTKDGDTIYIPENEQVWYGSNGEVTSVIYENNLTPTPELTNDIEETGDSFDLGIRFKYIANFFAEVANIPVGGCYVDYISDDTMASESSLKEGDIVVKIGDVWTFDEESVLVAKGLMRADEPTPVLYYRRGELKETEFVRVGLMKTVDAANDSASGNSNEEIYDWSSNSTIFESGDFQITLAGGYSSYGYEDSETLDLDIQYINFNDVPVYCKIESASINGYVAEGTGFDSIPAKSMDSGVLSLTVKGSDVSNLGEYEKISFVITIGNTENGEIIANSNLITITL